MYCVRLLEFHGVDAFWEVEMCDTLTDLVLLHETATDATAIPVQLLYKRCIDSDVLVAAVAVPASNVLTRNQIDRSEKAVIDIGVGHFRHRHADIIAFTTQASLHGRKCEFNGVEIGGVRRKVFTAHSPRKMSEIV